MNKDRFEVPADGKHGLLWSVCMPYLLPVIDDDEEFRNRFMKSFGYKSISKINDVQNLLKASSSGLNTEHGDFYNDSTLKTLVGETFRAKIIDTLSIADVKNRCMKTITLKNFQENHNNFYIASSAVLTHLKQQLKNIELKDLIFNQKINAAAIKNIEKDHLKAIDRDGKAEFLYDLYLKCLKENASSWRGGYYELMAMSYVLNCEIIVHTTSGTNVVKWNDYDCKVQLFYDGTGYSFRLSGTDEAISSHEQETANKSHQVKNEKNHSLIQNSSKFETSINVIGNMRMEYDASGLNSMFHGPVYQLKLLLLFLKRALNGRSNFRLATEWKVAEKFDDLVFLFQNESYEIIGWFLQAKHKKDESKKITYDDLSCGKSGEFSLEKYFISYVKMVNNRELKRVKIETLVIITNVDFDEQTVKDKQLLQKMETVCLMLDFEGKFGSKTPTRYRFIPDEKIKVVLRNARENNMRLLPAETVNNYIDQFFKKLVLAVDQPNEEELGQVIEKEVSSGQEMSSSFNLYCSKDIADQAQRNLLEFFKHKKVEFITHDTGKAIFEIVACEPFQEY